MVAGALGANCKGATLTLTRALPPVRWLFNLYCARVLRERDPGNQPNLTLCAAPPPPAPSLQDLIEHWLESPLRRHLEYLLPTTTEPLQSPPGEGRGGGVAHLVTIP